MTSQPPAATEHEFPSIEEVCPNEEGGPIARNGFNYQDEVVVGFLIEMIGDPQLVRVHCETHDDLVLVRDSEGERIAEFVQVKGGEPDRLWSVAALCQRDGNREVGSSIFEISLARDKHREASFFRLVTLREVKHELKVLTFPRGAVGRGSDDELVVELQADLDRRCDGACSDKRNGAAFWIERCQWDVRHGLAQIAKENCLAMLRLAQGEGYSLQLDQVEGLLDELRRWAKDAGSARWVPDRDKKIITRGAIRAWWERRVTELRNGVATTAGDKLADKLHEAGAEENLIALAVDLRRRYAALVRTSRYMLGSEEERLQARVKSEMMMLRTQFSAGEIDTTGVGFLNLCLQRLDGVNQERPMGRENRAAFLQGCMYDIADRCLLRFERPR